MSEERLKAVDLCMAEAVPFQQRHECRISCPIEEVLDGAYFTAVKANLRAGDVISVCRYADASFQKVLQWAELRVMEISPDKFRLHLRDTIEPAAKSAETASPNNWQDRQSAGGRPQRGRQRRNRP